MKTKSVWIAGHINAHNNLHLIGVFTRAKRAVKACGLPDHFVTGPVPINVAGPYEPFRYEYTWFPLRESKSDGKKRVDAASSEPVFTGGK